MNIQELHEWPRLRHEAVKIQHQFKSQIVLDGSLEDVRLIAGVDTAFDHINDVLFAAVCLFSYPELIEEERVTAWAPAAFPYFPGLHAFREGPVILKAFSYLRIAPDLVMFPAHGIAHPLRFGMAGHLGLILDVPSIGCARKVLVGDYEEVGPLKGSSSPLTIDGEQVGTVYRSRDHVKPIFISPGHRCGLSAAVDMTVKCLLDFRIPEPLQAAHRLANKIKHNSKQ